MENLNTELVLSADFELKVTDDLLSGAALEAYPELAGQYALVDNLRESTYLVNESIYNFLTLFAAPARLGKIYDVLGVKPSPQDQVGGFVDDLRSRGILITKRQNNELKKLIAEDEKLPPVDVSPATVIKVMKHTGYIWVGLVQDDTRPEPYVLKKIVLTPSLGKKEIKRRRDEFAHEAAMHKAAMPHPNIVTMYDADLEKCQMSIQYSPGKSIRKFVKEHNPGLDVRYGMITRILDIFDHLHAKGVLHGDIHSSNFLVNDDGEPMLFDFDMARSVEDKGLRNGKIGGVFSYAPPERISTEPLQIFNRKQTSRVAEVYQLGIIFYLILYHELPFDGATWKNLSGSILGLAPVWKNSTPAGDEIPDEVIGTLKKSLAKDPHKRFASVREFASAWKRALESLQVAACN